MAVITRFSFGAPVMVVKNNIPSPVGGRSWILGTTDMPSRAMPVHETLAEEEWDAIALKPLKKDRA